MGMFRNTRTGDVVDVPKALDKKFKARDDMEAYTAPKSDEPESKATTPPKA